MIADAPPTNGKSRFTLDAAFQWTITVAHQRENHEDQPLWRVGDF